MKVRLLFAVLVPVLPWPLPVVGATEEVRNRDAELALRCVEQFYSGLSSSNAPESMPDLFTSSRSYARAYDLASEDCSDHEALTGVWRYLRSIRELFMLAYVPEKDSWAQYRKLVLCRSSPSFGSATPMETSDDPSVLLFYPARSDRSPVMKQILFDLERTGPEDDVRFRIRLVNVTVNGVFVTPAELAQIEEVPLLLWRNIWKSSSRAGVGPQVSPEHRRLTTPEGVK